MIRTRYKVNPITGCWDWLLYKGKDGYGRELRANQPSTLAHVNSFVLHKGPVPEGLEVDHKCRNRGCINPYHLRAVTRQQNVPKGCRVHGAKLTPELVKEIRYRYRTEAISQLAMSKQYGVSQMTICNVTRCLVWKVDEDETP